MKELITLNDKKVLAAYSDGSGLDSVVAKVTALVDNFEYDLTTSKGRSAISSLSGKISKAKVRLDDLGKDLTVDWKAKAKAVDVSRNKMRGEMDALRDRARKPLTDWEDEEKFRILKLEEQVSTLAFYGSNALENWLTMSTADLKADLLVCENAVIDDSWQEFANKGAIAKDASIKTLRKIVEQAELGDANAALEKKRLAEEEEKARLEREEQLKLEATKAAEAKAEAEANRIKKEAEEKEQALIEEKRLAIERADLAEKTKAEEIRRVEDKAKADAVAEKQRIADEEAAERKAQEAREKNRKNVSRVRGEAKVALMKYVDEATAKKIVLAINAGKIPHVEIKY